MSFTASGIPIHTRSLSVTLRTAGERASSFAAYVLDLRKRGVVPVGGDLQGTGIIHQMYLDGTVDEERLAFKTITARMPTVAFEPSPSSEGESCRDRIDRVDHLAGTPLDASYSKRVGAEIGGPLGCSHVLTLAHLVGPTIAWALGRERVLHDPRVPRDPGERYFRRDMTVDGFVADGALELVGQMNDLHMREQASCRTAQDRLAEQLEVRMRGRLGLESMMLAEIEIWERRRDLATLDTAPWRSREDRAAAIAGTSLASGVSARLLREFGEPGDDRPLLDALLMLAPATIQCFASYRDTWTQLRGATSSETGGFTDSCYMWRRDGAFDRRREG